MRTPRRLALAGSLALAAACGSTPPAATAMPDAAVGPGPGSPDASTTSPSTMRFDLTTFTLQKGEEKVLCQYVPPDGKEHYIRKFTVDMAPGSHHLVVFRINDPNHTPASGPTSCQQQDVPMGFDGMLPGSQEQHGELALPDGVAMKIEPYHGLYFQEHYINATSGPITAKVSYVLDTVEKEKVQQMAGMVFYTRFSLKVPPLQKSMVTTSCKAPATVNLITATGHMHKRGIAFDALLNDKTIYHTDNWDEPGQSLFGAPGLAVTKGDSISYTCTYDNRTDKTFTFGSSAENNEMCIFAGVYYPSKDGATDFSCSK